MSEYYVHPSSVVDEGVTIGEGTRIWHFCHIQKGALIGRHCSLGQNVNVSNNVRIGDGCKLHQNRWCSDNGNQKLSIIRNTVFAVTGIGVILLYALSGNAHDYHLTRMVAAILISFGCYLPVTLMSKKHPKVGLLMIPKTCAYIWIIANGSGTAFLKSFYRTKSRLLL